MRQQRPEDTPAQRRKRLVPRAPSSGPADQVAPPVSPQAPLLAPSLVEARTYLCEVLDALAAHGAGLVVIGSHAVHERTKDVQIESTATKDSDLAVIPSLLASEPQIEAAMRAAGFSPLKELGGAGSRRFRSQTGLWGKGFADDGTSVAEVDLIVPAALADRRPRATPGHGTEATRTAAGIELATVDRDLLPVESFADGSVRDAWVAGTAALLCAKAFKLGERSKERDTFRPDGSLGRDRVLPKDAGDVWRLMAASNPAEVADTFQRLSLDRTVGEVAARGRSYLRAMVETNDLSRLLRIDLGGKTDQLDDVYWAWTRTFMAATDR